MPLLIGRCLDTPDAINIASRPSCTFRVLQSPDNFVFVSIYLNIGISDCHSIFMLFIPAISRHTLQPFLFLKLVIKMYNCSKSICESTSSHIRFVYATCPLMYTCNLHATHRTLRCYSLRYTISKSFGKTL